MTESNEINPDILAELRLLNETREIRKSAAFWRSLLALVIGLSLCAVVVWRVVR